MQRAIFVRNLQHRAERMKVIAGTPSRVGKQAAYTQLQVCDMSTRGPRAACSWHRFSKTQGMASSLNSHTHERIAMDIVFWGLRRSFTDDEWEFFVQRFVLVLSVKTVPRG
jgi:hypothetical protein